ncbi:MAG: hypothetical protein H6Q68_277 [Firmicutes bacterium]|nr:hypothetical protein [Bacillota bacterium]
MNEAEVQCEMSKDELEEFIMTIPQILKELEECVLGEKDD